MTLPAILAAFLIAVSAPPLALSLQTQRTSFDLLDSLPIEVVVHNASPSIQTLTFPQPTEYAIEVLRDGNVVWTSVPPSPPPTATISEHRRDFTPGATPLVVYDWNEVLRDGNSPVAGAYTVRARLLGGKFQPAATMRVIFAPPLPPGALASLKLGEEVTIAGELDSTHEVLGDDRGSARLSRRLLAAPAGVEIAVRGYASARLDGTRTFTFERWAPLAAAH